VVTWGESFNRTDHTRRLNRPSGGSAAARARDRLHDLTAGDADERFEFALDLLVRGLEAMAMD
jgi:hypothetical protein